MADRDRRFIGVVDSAIDWWAKSFRERPTLTVAATLLVLVAGSIGVYLDYKEKQKDNQGTASLEYSDQLEELNQVETSLRRLAEFVASQRKAVEDTEKFLDDSRRRQQQRVADAQSEVEELQAERERLKPLLEADRKIVSSLLALQRQQQRDEVWHQRWWGFVIGVVTSFLAGIVLNLIGRLVSRSRRVEIEFERHA